MEAVNLGDDAQNVVVSQAVDTNGHQASGRNQVVRADIWVCISLRCPNREVAGSGLIWGYDSGYDSRV